MLAAALTCMACLLAVTSSSVLAQQFQSPEVRDDRSVTFRLQAPEAEQVRVNIARFDGPPLELERQQRGIWEATTEPMPPGIYEYTFNVDGTRMLDPRNRWVKKWYSLQSMFEVPGDPPLVTESQGVPHGTLHHHTYRSDVTDSDRGVIVYTPPGYATDTAKMYPVVVLMHGFGDDQTAWTEVGRAHLIADNLIATQAIQPMVIAMPYGHPVDLPYGDRPSDYFERNNQAMRADVIQQVMPLVEQHYRVSRSPAERAIVGLSMGGGHALDIGLKNTDVFDWVGAFSAAAPEGDLSDHFPKLVDAPEKHQPSLLWIAIGEDDFLLERNQQFIERLKEAGVKHTYLETNGGHSWEVWRDYLPKFLQAIFR